MGEVVVVKDNQPLPESWRGCILLGDTRAVGKSSSDARWRTDLVKSLQRQWSADGRLVVIFQNAGDTTIGDDPRMPDRWSNHVVDAADVAAYWWPADTDPRLMRATLKAWHDGRPVIYGASSELMRDAQAQRYFDYRSVSVVTSLSEMAATIMERLGPGIQRFGGERDVPLSVWRTDSFQRWYSAQVAAGNTLLAARLVWTFNIGRHELTPLFWALHVKMHIGSENRAKANEVVISRPDISVITLYCPRPRIDETVIVLIREFRSPASTPDGLVHELPGGSGEEVSKLEQAITEAKEEIGLTIEPRRVSAYGGRQLAATVSAHQAHLFAAEISNEELSWLRSRLSVSHGSTRETELTWTEITTFREIRQKRLVDWATFGMISQVLLDRYDDSAGK